MKKHGTIAVVGAPNAGKSTLTNALLGQKLTIVSSKVQTTRNSIRAIVIEKETQMVLIDTPGIFIPREDKILERIIVKSAWQALREAEHICFVVDAKLGMNQENLRIIADLQKEGLPMTVVLNKTDEVRNSLLLESFAKLSDLGVQDILPISALTLDGVDKLKTFLCEKCLNPDWIYDEDQITDAPMRFVASEITREKLFLKLNQELPYSLTVKTDTYDVLDNGQIKIRQTILVTRESQKGIVLGKKGSMIREVGEESRKDLTKIAGKKVHLFLFVKVKENWMNDSESYERVDVEKLPKN